MKRSILQFKGTNTEFGGFLEMLANYCLAHPNITLGEFADTLGEKQS